MTADRHFFFPVSTCKVPLITSTPLSILNCGRAIWKCHRFDLIWFAYLFACLWNSLHKLRRLQWFQTLSHTIYTRRGKKLRALPIFHLYGENKNFYRQPLPFPRQRTTHTRFPTKIFEPFTTSPIKTIWKQDFAADSHHPTLYSQLAARAVLLRIFNWKSAC